MAHSKRMWIKTAGELNGDIYAQNSPLADATTLRGSLSVGFNISLKFRRILLFQKGDG